MIDAKAIYDAVRRKWKMTRCIWIFGPLVIWLGLSMPAVAQEINLSGTWVLDRDESDLGGAPGRMGQGSGGSSMPGGPAVGGGKDFPAEAGRRGGDLPGGGEHMPGGNRGGGSMTGDRQGGDLPGVIDSQNAEMTLFITQSEKELKVTRTYHFDDRDLNVTQIFSLNGNDNINMMGMGQGEFFSKTTVEKGKIVNLGTQFMSTPERTIAVKEEYSLSNNGQTLTLKTERTTAQGGNSSKMVFRRKTDTQK